MKAQPLRHVLEKCFYWKRLVGIPKMRGQVTLASETCLVCQFSVTLSTALNLVHRNSFPKLSYFTQLCKFPGGASFEKHADPEKMNWNRRKLRANSRNLLEPFLRSRKEENLYGHCAMKNEECPKNSFKRLYIVEGLLVSVKKLRFRKNFDKNFNAVERVTRFRSSSFFSLLQKHQLDLSHIGPVAELPTCSPIKFTAGAAALKLRHILWASRIQNLKILAYKFPPRQGPTIKLQ